MLYRLFDSSIVYFQSVTIPLVPECRLHLWPPFGDIATRDLPKNTLDCTIYFPGRGRVEEDAFTDSKPTQSTGDSYSADDGVSQVQDSNDIAVQKRHPEKPRRRRRRLRHERALGLLVELLSLNVPCSSGGWLSFGPHEPENAENASSSPERSRLCGKLEELDEAQRRTHFPLPPLPLLRLHGSPKFALSYKLVDYCHEMNLMERNASIQVRASPGLSCTFNVRLPYGYRVSLRLLVGSNSSKEPTIVQIPSDSPGQRTFPSQRKAPILAEAPSVTPLSDSSRHPTSSSKPRRLPREDPPKSGPVPTPSLPIILDQNRITNDVVYPIPVVDTEPKNIIISSFGTAVSSRDDSPSESTMCPGVFVTIDERVKWSKCVVASDTPTEFHFLSTGNLLGLSVRAGDAPQDVLLSYNAQPVDAIVRSCPFGWVAIGQFCVSVVEDFRLPWKEAEDECANRGGHLASIGSVEVQRAIDELLRNSPGYSDHNSYWVGASDINTENKFEWTDKQPFNYESVAY